MKAFITGMGGFVGSHLCDYLLDETDWEVVGTLRASEPVDNLDAVSSRINTGDRVRTVEVDINDLWALDRALAETRPDYVFHLAAQSYPPASFDNPAETLRTNILGTLNVLQACEAQVPNAWIHVCSSAEVYGRTKTKNLSETAPFHPASPYSVSKIGTDLLGQLYASYDHPIVVTRMFTHTGPRRGDVFMESTFAKQIAMIEAGLLEPPVKVGNLESVRTIADVRDAVRAYHMALTVDPTPAVYNIAGANTCTVREVLDLLFSLSSHYDVEVDPARLRPIDADLQIPDCRKFTDHTGWTPQIPLEQTLADLLDYWRERVTRTVPLQR